MKNTVYIGIFFMFLSTLIFSFLTIVVKIASSQYNIPSVEISFFRFAWGLLFSLLVLAFHGFNIKPVNIPVLICRGVSNSAAVILFFISIDLAGVTKGNIYNLTYPVFVAILAPFFLKEKLTAQTTAAIIIGFFGTWLVSRVGIEHITLHQGDVAGILSGIAAGFSIVFLRKARKTDSSITILLFVMGTGTVLNGLIFYKYFIQPDVMQLFLLFFIGVLSFSAQMAITYGYKYINASPGAVISTSRIFFAALLSSAILGEVLTPNILVGGACIFVSVLIISYRKKTR